METQELLPTLARCEVTGKMVPDDELVTINGQRVCAEGKAILLDRLKAGEAMPGELRKPSVWRRFCCIFVDGLIIGVPFAIVNVLVRTGNLQNPMAATLVAGAVSLIGVLVQFVYFGQMHASRGQTVGKMAGKLKVVRLDGGPISTGTAYVRSLAYVGPSFLSGIAMLVGSFTGVAVAGLIVGCYSVANVLFALFDRSRQRALHDRIAGTRVIHLS